MFLFIFCWQVSLFSFLAVKKKNRDIKREKKYRIMTKKNSLSECRLTKSGLDGTTELEMWTAQRKYSEADKSKCLFSVNFIKIFEFDQN